MKRQNRIRPARRQKMNPRSQEWCEALEPRLMLAAYFATSNTITTSDNGGPIIATPHVILMFWGANWTNGTSTPQYLTIINALADIFGSAYTDDLTTYRSGFGHASISFTYLFGDTSPGANFTNANVQTFVTNEIQAQNVPLPKNDSNYLYMVITQNGSTDPTEGLNGEHSYGSDTQASSPDTTRFHYAWTANNGTLDFVTNTLSHELVEAMTDPEGNAIQVNPRNTSAWSEVSDSTAQNYSARLDGYQVQSYWVQSKKRYEIPYGANFSDIDATGATIVVNGDQRFANDSFIVTNDAFGNIQINLNNETISFLNSFNGVKINTGAGSNDINIAANFARAVQVIGGSGYNTVYFLGTSGADNLYFYTNGVAGCGYTSYNSTNISAYEISTFGGGDTVHIWGSDRPLTVVGGSGNDSFYIESYNVSTSLTIYGQGGSDYFYITPSANDLTNLSAISSLYLDGNNGNAHIVINNANTFAADWNYNVSPAATVPGGDTNYGTISASKAGYYLSITYASINQLTISGDVGNDNFYLGAGAGVIPSVSFYGNDGNDTFNIGGGNLLGSATAINCFGQGGYNTMVLDDRFSIHGKTWTVYDGAAYLGTAAYAYGYVQSLEIIGGIALGGASTNYVVHGLTNGIPLTIIGNVNNDNLQVVNNTAAY
ncbi:MAG: hypothetical protein WCI73_08330, partial [Phycisphaerae bacterium]